MILVLKQDMHASDAEKPRNARAVSLPPGRYEAERVENPYGYANAPWIVLKGTTIGRPVSSWRIWENAVVIEE